MVGPLLDFIGRYESSNNYNAVHSSVKHKPRNLTDLTIAQVLEWQAGAKFRGERSTAAGRYQVIRQTLREIYPLAGLRLTDRFNERSQDAICRELLRRRGMEKYIIGKISLETFCISIAKEWASMPLVAPTRGKRAGQSYYAGDGLNMAHAPIDGLISAVEQLK